jgi:hypothetical protein
VLDDNLDAAVSSSHLGTTLRKRTRLPPFAFTVQRTVREKPFESGVKVM